VPSHLRKSVSLPAAGIAAAKCYFVVRSSGFVSLKLESTPFRLTRLNKLKKSTRNCRLTSSVIAVAFLAVRSISA